MNYVNLCFSLVQPNTIKYREYNKKRYASEKRITCECGSEVIKHNMPKHIHSKKHNNLLTRIDKDDVDKRGLSGGDEEPTSEVN